MFLFTFFLVFFEEEQYRDYGTYRTRGLDSMVILWCDDLNRVFSQHRDYRTDRTSGLDSMVGIVWCDDLNRVFAQHRDYRTDRTPGLDSMGGVVWCDESVRTGGTVTTLCRPGFSRRGRTWSCPHSSWSSLERGCAGL